MISFTEDEATRLQIKNGHLTDPRVCITYTICLKHIRLVLRA